jgi:putative aminopeptidase FrvX
MDLLDQLAQLCATPGVSGFEEPIAAKIKSFLDPLGVEVLQDQIGNLAAHFPGSGPRVALFAHMDEVGLVVRKIHPEGFLLVERIGGTTEHVLPGQRMQVWTPSGPLQAVVGALPQHLASSHDAPLLSRMYLDMGTRDRLSGEACGVEVGLPVTYAPSFERLQDRIASKSLDDRAGCAILLQLAERLKAQPPSADLYLVFVVQEETVLRGAIPMMYELQPDYAIGVDATLSFDTPDLADGQTEVKLGQGVVFKVMDHIRGSGLGFISHQGLRRYHERLAQKNGLLFQREVVTGLSTAATPLPFIRSGLPVMGLSFPLRYAHSPVEVADLADLHAILNLIEQAVRHPWQSD